VRAETCGGGGGCEYGRHLGMAARLRGGKLLAAGGGPGFFGLDHLLRLFLLLQGLHCHEGVTLQQKENSASRSMTAT